MTAPKMTRRRAKAKVLILKSAFHKRKKRVAVKNFPGRGGKFSECKVILL
jgi:hypothetical protein